MGFISTFLVVTEDEQASLQEHGRAIIDPQVLRRRMSEFSRGNEIWTAKLLEYWSAADGIIEPETMSAFMPYAMRLYIVKHSPTWRHYAIINLDEVRALA